MGDSERLPPPPGMSATPVVEEDFSGMDRDQLIRELKKNKNLVRYLDVKFHKVEQLKNKIEEQEKEISGLHQQLQQAQSKVQSEHVSGQTEAQELYSKLQRAQTDLGHLRELLQHGRSEASQLRGQLEKKDGEMDKLHKEIGALKEHLARTQNTVTSTEYQRRQQEERMAAAVAEVEGKYALQLKNQENIMRQMNDELTQLRQKISSQAQLVSRLEQENARLREQQKHAPPSPENNNNNNNNNAGGIASPRQQEIMRQLQDALGHTQMENARLQQQLIAVQQQQQQQHESQRGGNNGGAGGGPQQQQQQQSLQSQRGAPLSPQQQQQFQKMAHEIERLRAVLETRDYEIQIQKTRLQHLEQETQFLKQQQQPQLPPTSPQGQRQQPIAAPSPSNAAAETRIEQQQKLLLEQQELLQQQFRRQQELVEQQQKMFAQQQQQLQQMQEQQEQQQQKIQQQIQEQIYQHQSTSEHSNNNNNDNNGEPHPHVLMYPGNNETNHGVHPPPPPPPILNLEQLPEQMPSLQRPNNNYPDQVVARSKTPGLKRSTTPGLHHRHKKSERKQRLFEAELENLQRQFDMRTHALRMENAELLDAVEGYQLELSSLRSQLIETKSQLSRLHASIYRREKERDAASSGIVTTPLHAPRAIPMTVSPLGVDALISQLNKETFSLASPASAMPMPNIRLLSSEVASRPRPLSTERSSHSISPVRNVARDISASYSPNRVSAANATRKVNIFC